MRRPAQAFIIGLACVWPLSGQAQTVSQYILGTVAGSSTKDVLGLFGPAGANLAGKQITLYFQYVVTDLTGYTGCDEPAYYGCSVRYTTGSGGLTEPAIPGSILIVVGINGVRYTYAPSDVGSVEIRDATAPLKVANTLSLDIQSLAPATSYGVSSTELGIAYAKPIVFGRALSPSNTPLTGDQGDFFGLQTGVKQPNGTDSYEPITFSVTGSSQ